MADSSNVLQVKVDGFLGGVCISRYREAGTLNCDAVLRAWTQVKARMGLMDTNLVMASCFKTVPFNLSCCLKIGDILDAQVFLSVVLYDKNGKI